MTAPESPLPDLGLRALARLCRAQWRENPLCRRLWTRIRPWALVVALVMTAQSGVGASMALLGVAPGPGMLFSPAYLALLGGTCFFGLLSFAFWIGAPIWYAKWAWRTTWTENEQLRAAPMPRTDRLMGILVPVVVAQVVVHAFGMLTMPLAMGLSARSSLPAVPAGPLAIAAFAVSGISVSVAGMAASLLLTPTVVFRTLLLDSATGAAEGRKALSVAWPFVAIVVIGGMWGGARVFPVIALAIAMTRGMADPFVATVAWAAIVIFQVAGDFLLLWGEFAAMRAFWRHDIPAARRVLFR